MLRTNISLKEEVKSVEHSLGGRQFHRTDNSTNQSFAEENLKECSCDYVVCWCHQRTSPSSLYVQCYYILTTVIVFKLSGFFFIFEIVWYENLETRIGLFLDQTRT